MAQIEFLASEIITFLVSLLAGLKYAFKILIFFTYNECLQHIHNKINSINDYYINACLNIAWNKYLNTCMKLASQAWKSRIYFWFSFCVGRSIIFCCFALYKKKTYDDNPYKLIHADILSLFFFKLLYTVFRIMAFFE